MQYPPPTRVQAHAHTHTHTHTHTHLSIIKQLLGLGAHMLILEDTRVGTVRVLPTELPDLEERLPIDVTAGGQARMYANQIASQHKSIDVRWSKPHLVHIDTQGMEHPA